MIRSGQSLSGRERNCAFLNTGGGWFATGSAVAGFDMDDDSRGLALTDWDGDGRLDAWVSGRTAPRVRFLRNEHARGGNWIAFRLRGGGAVNRDAIGARVELTVGETILVRTLRAGDSFLSQSDKLLHFGLGTGDEAVEAAVVWPDGKRIALGTLPRDASYLLAYPDQLTAAKAGTSATGWESGEALPALPFRAEGAMRLVYPVPLPEMRLRGADGAPIMLGPPGEGRFRLLNLWNPSCAGCEEELTELTANAAALREAGIEVVTALGPGEAGMKEAAASRRAIAAPFLFGQLSENDTMLLDAVLDLVYGMERELVLPTSLLIGRGGELEAVYLGAVRAGELLDDAALLRTLPATAAERADALHAGRGRWVAVDPQANRMAVPLKLMEQGRVADTAAFIRRWSKLLNRSKEYGRLLVWVGDEMNKHGETREALTFYLNALQSGTNDPLVMNNVAWQMATHRDPRVRNGAEAVKWAERAVLLTGRDNPAYLDTLAAAYAESGNFSRALSTVDEALRLAESLESRELLPGLRKARASYGAGKPFREGP